MNINSLLIIPIQIALRDGETQVGAPDCMLAAVYAPDNPDPHDIPEDRYIVARQEFEETYGAPVQGPSMGADGLWLDMENDPDLIRRVESSKRMMQLKRERDWSVKDDSLEIDDGIAL
jgi:hypothetical protein